MPRGFAALVAAQFCSALADNALLIVAIALLVQQGQPAWWVPLLKFVFTLAYVVLAPFVGVLADSWRKARVMMATNALKAFALTLLLAGAAPLVVLALVGVGAAAYAPAKYGLVTELVPPRRLVAANAWIEVTTVCAALFGVVLGGALVGAGFGNAIREVWPAADPLQVAMLVLLASYTLAAAINLRIPDSGARYRALPRRPGLWLASSWRGFRRSQRRLWADADGALSMGLTTLFWGAAAVLQFAVLRWADERLGLSLEHGAYLQAVVAVGVALGAILAGRLVPLAQARRVLPLGVLMGLGVPLVAWVSDWRLALPLLLLVGALGGALVVPLNALLQHRGHVLLSAGRSIAVQNFNENLSVLVAISAYAALVAGGLDIRALMALLGLVVAAVVVAAARLSAAAARPA